MANEQVTLLAPPGSVIDHHGKSNTGMDDVIMAGSPKDRLKVRVVQTPPTHEASTPMSTCSSEATTTDATFSNRSSTCSSEDASFSFQSSSTSSIRVPIPSPSRGRLDRQYAKRLATSSVFYLNTPSARSPLVGTPGATNSSAKLSISTTTTIATATATTATTTSNTTIPASGSLMTPPEIARDCDSSFFRPIPILTSADSPTTEYMHQAPRQFFFPSTATTPTPRHESAGSFGSLFTFNSSSTTGMSTSSRRRTSASGIVHPMDLGTSDRFIPSRATSNMKLNLWESMNGSLKSPRRKSPYNSNDAGTGTDGNGSNHHNHTVAGDDSNAASTGTNTAAGRNTDSVSATQQNLHSILLRSELLGENISPYASHLHNNNNSSSNNSSRIAGQNGNATPLRDGLNRFRFQGPRQAYHDTIYHDSMGPTEVVNSFSLTPFGSASSQRLMAAPQKRRRKIAKVPFKVLDAPALQDDFYLNLVDWSSQNVLAVGLGSCVYLWSACTSKVTKLCDLAPSDDIVTSVSWAQRGTHLAVGTNKGEVQLWDTIKLKKVRTMSGHTARVGTLAWTGPILASGSRDRLIFLRDVRVPTPFTDRLSAHRQEVCGLRWSFDEPAFLASGGNDNQLHVVDSRHPSQPVHRFSDHTAAVKAIAWSPHQHGLLASGGGTADRCIRFWNTLSGSALSSVDTGSQVCNLAWSQNCNEIVSTHGYSLNQIVVWRYPSLSKVVTLTGHTYRVLYLAVSPDGSTIVTGAGDETLRFWQVFPGPRSDAKNNAGGLLFPNTLGSVIR
jgi:cell division cycle 20-like protein 1 (cofactor of APC complex)